MAMRGRGMDAGARDNADLPTRFHGRPTSPGARVFPPRDDRLDEIPGLKPAMRFLPRQMTDGKPMLVGAAPLAITASFGRPDRDIRG